MKEDTQWDLLVCAEDIQPRHLIEVDCDGDTQEMMFIKATSKTVFLKDNDGNVRKFSAEDLESLDPDFIAVIVGVC
jgi:hypothetical protein